MVEVVDYLVAMLVEKLKIYYIFFSLSEREREKVLSSVDCELKEVRMIICFFNLQMIM
jgi:hypothetical protein